jgi:DNA-binding response OmpR family regulator
MKPELMKSEVPERILVVDDEPAARMMMQATLEEAGFIVETADCCEQARELFRQKEFDLILLDVLLPDGDGYELCREMRAKKVDVTIPVAIVTGLDDLESIRYAYESGATDFITKPVAWGTLPYRVKYLLRSAQTLTKLSVSEGKNRALLTNLPDIILCVRVDGRVNDVQAGVNVQNVSGWYYQPEVKGHLYIYPALSKLVSHT